MITLWGTGLGPVTGNEAGQPLPGNLANVNARVFVGGREAAIQYRGRSGCCVGIDQIVFTVPAGVDGCHVPVSVQVGNVVSNFTSMSVSANGGPCSSPGSYSPADLERARTNGGLRIGAVGLSKTVLHLSIPGLGSFDSKVDTGFGTFQRITLDQILSQDGSANALNPGSCSVSVQRVGSGVQPPVAQITGLNAGSALTVNGPNGTKSIAATPNAAGVYISTPPLSQSIPFGASQPDYIVPGAYTITGPGGPDFGSFTANLTVPGGTTWANEAQVSIVNRANGQLITWTGGDPNSFVYIAGGSVNTTNTASGSFVCYERAAVGSFTIPSSVLLAIPSSATIQGTPTGSLSVGGVTAPTTFTASGIDIGVASYVAFVSKQVTYQ